MNIPPGRASPVERDAVSEDMRELSPIAPPTVHEIASAVSMVAGAGVPNNDLRPPRVRPVEANIAFKNMRGRWLLDPDPAPQRMWIGKLLFVFSLAAIALVAALLVLLNEVRKDAGGIAAAVSPLVVDNRSGPSVQPARLVVQSGRGFANEPLPLGVSLVDASGEESLVLIGLVAGSRLSVGTPFGSTGWQLSAGSIGNAFVYAPTDFVGVMDAVIDLRSASNQPIDVQVLRFEWIRKKEGYLTPQPDPSKPPPVIPPLEPEEIAAVVSPLVVDNRSGPSVQPAPQPDPSKPPPMIPPLDPEEIEARSALAAAAGSEAAQVRQAGEVASQQLRQALEEERERVAALTGDLAAARQEIDARGVLAVKAAGETAEVRQSGEAAARQLRQALEEERERGVALTRDLATARQEIDARGVLAAAAGSEAAEVRQAGEAAARQLRQALEEERERGVALTRSLAAARQEIEARGVLVAEIRQASEAVARQLRQALEEERGRVGALTRDLAAARREIEAPTALAATATEPVQAVESTTAQRLPAPKEERQRVELPAGQSAALGHPTSRDADIAQRPVSSDAQVPIEAKKLITRAEMFLSRGDISAARILLGRALDMGSAEAGFRLAESYDPVVLSARRALGTHGDRARARELYSRAYEAGIQEAKDRMDALR